MSGRIVFALSLIVLLTLGLPACGGDGTTTTTETTETTAPKTTKLRVYFLRDGKVQPVAREAYGVAVAARALSELADGPTAIERRDLKLSSEVPRSQGAQVLILDGTAAVDFEGLSRAGLAQVVYTLTQFPTVKQVDISGKRYTRADFEDETPIILVESPLPFETVANPLRATGTANTFEATFQYEVVEPEGRIVEKNFVTATSGSGQRGTFDFKTRPYEISRPGLGALVVFEYSAKDGSRIHIMEIPVQMSK